MRTLTRIGIALVVLAASAFAGDQYLVRTSSSKIGEVAARHGLTVLRGFRGDRNLFLVKLPAGKNIGEVATDAAVQNVEPNGSVFLPEAAPGVSLQASSQVPGLSAPKAVQYYGVQTLGAYVNQPAALVIGLNPAHGFASGAGIVAILDTGVDPNHPVLQNSLVPGYDFTRNIPGGSEMTDLDQSTTAILDQSTTAILDDLQSTTAILDKTGVLVLNQSTTAILDQSTTAILDTSKLPAEFGHGTMVAGIVHLAAPTAMIMPVKVFSADGSSTMALIIEGIEYAVANGADVINMSFSTTQPSTELQQAIANATAAGVICVASVGNDGQQEVVYPAGYNVIGVASTNDQFQRSSFSNYGGSVDVAAPGEGVITLYPGNNYAAAWGTSFSAPFAAGGAALLVQISSDTNQAAATQALDRAIPIGQQLGAGELNLPLACLYREFHSN